MLYKYTYTYIYLYLCVCVCVCVCVCLCVCVCAVMKTMCPSVITTMALWQLMHLAHLYIMYPSA